MRFVHVLFSSMAMLAAVAASLQAAVWPGAAPCDTTLQACIDGVPAGETVLVDSVAPVVEDLTIAKSVTLTSQAGPAATLEGSLLLQSGATATSIHVSDLIVEGTIRAVARAGDLDVHIVGTLVISDVDNRPAVDLVSDFTLPNAGNLTAEVRGNEIRMTGSPPGDSCGGIAVVPTTSPQTVATIVGNTLFVSGCQGTGIGVAPGVGRTVTVDVLRNQLEVPNTGFGISLQNAAPGPTSTLTGRVVGNLVRGEFFGVGVSAINSAAGTLALQLRRRTGLPPPPRLTRHRRGRQRRRACRRHPRPRRQSAHPGYGSRHGCLRGARRRTGADAHADSRAHPHPDADPRAGAHGGDPGPLAGRPDAARPPAGGCGRVAAPARVSGYAPDVEAQKRNATPAPTTSGAIGSSSSSSSSANWASVSIHCTLPVRPQRSLSFRSRPACRV
jgi:hypothetical protein